MPPERRARHSLALVRRQIDRLDERILRLVNRRVRFALEIGQIKKHRKWPVFDAAREAAVLRRVGGVNRGPLSTRAAQRIFQAVLRECRRRERVRKHAAHAR